MKWFRSERTDLDQSCNSGCCFRMSDVGFYRTDNQRPVVRPALTVHGLQCPDLDRVPQGRSGAVRLDMGNIDGRNSRGFERARMRASCDKPLGAVRPLLGPSWLTAEPRMTARILSFSRSARSKRFKTIRPQPSLRTYPSADASKVLQRPCLGEHAGPGVGHAYLRTQDKIDPSGERQVTFALVQAPAGQMNGDQRGRTGRID